MGKKNPDRSFDNDDDFLFSDDLDIDSFEEEHFEKSTRGRGHRKSRRSQLARNRFSDYEGERWLKRQLRDWDDYDTLDDADDAFPASWTD